MVSGIQSGGGSGRFFASAFSRDSGTFSVSDDNPRNLLQIDPTFKPPSTELREAERQRREDNPFQQANERRNRAQNPLANQVRSEVLFGDQSARRIEAEQNEPLNIGGSALDVRGGSVTFRSGDQSIEINEGDDARVLENDDGITVVNRDTEDEITFERGSEVNVGGEGTAEITGRRRETIRGGGTSVERVRSSTMSLERGDELTVGRNAEGRSTLLRPDSAESLQISDRQTNISISGDAGEQFTVSNDRGRSIQFKVGESGTVTTNDDGTITIENENTGDQVQFSTDLDLNTDGNATATFRNDASETLTIDGSEQGRFQTSEEGNLELANASTVEETEVQERREPPRPERPVRLRTVEDPNLGAQQLLQEQLLSEPVRQAREQAEAEEAEETEELSNDEEEESPAGNTTEEPREETPVAASFRKTDDNGVLEVAEEETDPAPGTPEEDDDDSILTVDNTNEEIGFSTGDSEEDDTSRLEFEVETNEEANSESTGIPGFNNQRLRQAFFTETSSTQTGGELNLYA